ncbi:MAG: dephospho-CoA kinase [Prosthecobacter sp.]
MISWVITGGLGCGKSTAASLLKVILGDKMEVFSSDDVVRVSFESPELKNKLRVEFGPLGLPEGDTESTRAWLRQNILPHLSLRERLEAIIHPKVFAGLEEARIAARLAGVNLFLAEVPLHYETGSAVSADFVIVVASSRSVQVRRMMETRGLNELNVQQFLDAQWPIEAKVERADAVIWNDGSVASLEAQLLTLASPLLQA